MAQYPNSSEASGIFNLKDQRTLKRVITGLRLKLLLNILSLQEEVVVRQEIQLVI